MAVTEYLVQEHTFKKEAVPNRSASLSAEPDFRPEVRLSARIVTSLEAFDNIATAWTDLIHRSGIPAISHEHAWLSRCLEFFPPAEIFVILLEDEATGRLVGAAPFKIDRTASGIFRRTLRRVQFIGTDPCVYEWMGVILDPSLDGEKALRFVARILRDNRERWDVLDLRFLRDEAQARLLLECVKKSHGLLVQDTSIPYIALPDNVEDFKYKVCKKKQRRNLTNLHNTLQKDFPDRELRLVFHPPGAELDDKIDTFSERHIEYWQQRGVCSDFVRYPCLKAFYKALLRRYPMAEMGGNREKSIAHSRLLLGDEVLGDEISIWQENGTVAHICTYSDDYGKYRPSKLHMEALMYETIAGGGNLFSFGRGDEEYKSHWTDDKIPLWSLLGFRDRRAAIYWRLDEALKQGRDLLTSLPGKLRKKGDGGSKT